MFGREPRAKQWWARMVHARGPWHDPPLSAATWPNHNAIVFLGWLVFISFSFSFLILFFSFFSFIFLWCFFFFLFYLYFLSFLYFFLVYSY
jgi:hypothetical protein